MTASNMAYELAEDVGAGTLLWLGPDGRLHARRTDPVPLCAITLKSFTKGEVIDLAADGRPMTQEEWNAL